MENFTFDEQRFAHDIPIVNKMYFYNAKCVALAIALYGGVHQKSSDTLIKTLS